MLHLLLSLDFETESFFYLIDLIDLIKKINKNFY
jgi:hypothetical protein